MYREAARVRCAIIRGGTSKGVFLMENQVPADPAARDKFILRLFGSPDQRQIDGLGGANSLTSKVCIIGPSTRSDADVDYTFGQVSIVAAVIDWKGNCGNLSSAVGPFAIDEGLVKAVEPITTVRIHNTNTKKLIIARVPVKDGVALSNGNYAIPGVPGTGARIDLEFQDPGGSVTGRILPTGNPRDLVKVDGTEFNVSIVDAGNPVVFMLAEELGLMGTELPTHVEGMPEVLQTLEKVRSVVAEMIGIVPDKSLATRMQPAIPKIGSPGRARRVKESVRRPETWRAPARPCFWRGGAAGEPVPEGLRFVFRLRSPGALRPGMRTCLTSCLQRSLRIPQESWCDPSAQVYDRRYHIPVRWDACLHICRSTTSGEQGISLAAAELHRVGRAVSPKTCLWLPAVSRNEASWRMWYRSCSNSCTLAIPKRGSQ